MVTFHIAETALAALLLAALVYGPWQWACSDLARQRMFQSRDALFDMARAGDLDFGSQIYRTIRAEMNNMIRFAHGLTWLRVAIFARFVRGSARRTAPIYDAVDSIEDCEVRRKVARLVSDIELSAIRMILMKSPFLICLFALSVISVLPIVAMTLCYFYARQFKDLIPRLGVVIQSEAALIRA